MPQISHPSEARRGPSTQVTALVSAPLADTWEVFVPVKLPEIFPSRKGPIPAVTGTSGQEGRWDRAGNSRYVHLADGATVCEEITDSEPSDGRPATSGTARFAYKVTQFTGPLGAMTRAAYGDWLFEETSDGKTRITWTYRFEPTSRLAALPLRLILSTFWHAFMADALAVVKSQSEAQAV